MKLQSILVTLSLIFVSLSCSLVTDFGDEKKKEECSNGLDDDGDGFIDCDDQDCELSELCAAEREMNCADGNDNDGDGFTDCADQDCKQAPNCVSSPEICDNGFDDDGDGFIDCDDQECRSDPACPGMEDCSNGIDDNDDGLVDCADPYCQGLPECETVPCDMESAWWDAPSSCEDGINECTFEVFPVEQTMTIGAICAPTGSEHYSFSTDGYCPKGDIQMGGACMTICGESHGDCPEYINNTFQTECKSFNTPKGFEPFSYCVVQSACDPVNNGGCPGEMDCKMWGTLWGDITSGFVVEPRQTYCSTSWSFAGLNDPCFSDEECAPKQGCVKRNNEPQGVCLQACNNAAFACTDSDAICMGDLGASQPKGFCIPNVLLAK